MLDPNNKTFESRHFPRLNSKSVRIITRPHCGQRPTPETAQISPFFHKRQMRLEKTAPLPFLINRRYSHAGWTGPSSVLNKQSRCLHQIGFGPTIRFAPFTRIPFCKSVTARNVKRICLFPVLLYPTKPWHV